MRTQLAVFIILLGLVGVVVFFPLKLGRDCTCLGQGCLNDDNGADLSAVPDTTQAGVSTEEEPAAYERLLRHYLFPYAILWWGSVGLLVLGFYYLGKSGWSKTGDES